MPIDAFDPGDPDTRPYPFPYFPRTETGEPMLAVSNDDMTPRPGILNGRRYERVTPMPAGTRAHAMRHERYASRAIELTVPDVPAIDPDTMQER